MAKSKEQKYEEAVARNIAFFNCCVGHYKGKPLFAVKHRLGIRSDDFRFDDMIRTACFNA